MNAFRGAALLVALACCAGSAGSCFYSVEDLAGRTETPPPPEDASPDSGGSGGSGGSISTSDGAPDPSGSCQSDQLCVPTAGRVVTDYLGYCPEAPEVIFKCAQPSCSCTRKQSSDGSCDYKLAISSGLSCELPTMVKPGKCTSRPGIASVRLTGDASGGLDCKVEGVGSSALHKAQYCARPPVTCGAGLQCVPRQGACLLLEAHEPCPIAGWKEAIVSRTHSAAGCQCECEKCTNSPLNLYESADCSGPAITILPDADCLMLPLGASSFSGPNGGGRCGARMVPAPAEKLKLCCAPDV